MDPQDTPSWGDSACWPESVPVLLEGRLRVNSCSSLAGACEQSRGTGHARLVSYLMYLATQVGKDSV